MDTKTLLMFNYENPPTKNMPRKKEVSQQYDEYIKIDGPKKFLKTLNEELDRSLFYFCKNSFPYNVEEPIKHSCLWYRGKTTKEEVEDFLNKNNIQYITFFENPNHLKSVKEVCHFHVFHY